MNEATYPHTPSTGHGQIDDHAAHTLDKSAPAVRQFGDRVAAAGEAFQAKTAQLRNTRDAWVDGGRTSVRTYPLLSVAAAFALGAVIARITR
jgi:hypothetical protein